MIVDYMGECKPPSDGDLAEVGFLFLVISFLLQRTNKQTDKSRVNRQNCSFSKFGKI